MNVDGQKLWKKERVPKPTRPWVAGRLVRTRLVALRHVVLARRPAGCHFLLTLGRWFAKLRPAPVQRSVGALHTESFRSDWYTLRSTHDA